MNRRTLRRWHRNAGLLLAPFLLLQALSGLFLSYGIYRRVGSLIREETAGPVYRLWDLLMAKAHYGPGLSGLIYHGFLGAGLLWILFSGTVIFFRLHRARRKSEG